MTAAPLLPEIRLEDQPSAESARAFFQRDRLMAAYALADIDAAEIEKARWWTATRGNEVVACALVVEALPFRPCFASGESEALVAIFRDGIHEPRIVVATPPAGRLAVESVYRFERVEKMHRMAVTASTFRPRVTHPVTRLGPEHLDDIIDLYGHASRTYFTAARLEREIYFGVYVGKTIVSAAGTHVRSRISNIAAVGNVLTRLAYRDRGMATSVTSAATEAALEQHRDVVLNVRQDNAPAIAVYDRLGFHVHGPFIEGPAVRRSAWDRILGRMR
jgi:RimJ/RimL family protein N-acetyltransferase